MALFFHVSSLPLQKKRRSFHRINRVLCTSNVLSPLTPPPSQTRRKVLYHLGLAPLASLICPPSPSKASGFKSPGRERLYDSHSGSFVPTSAVSALLRRDVGNLFNHCIVAAEIHDNCYTHAAQLAIINEAKHLPDGMPLTVGFEQFYRSHNPFLKAFVQGNLTMAELLQKTNWDQTWGFDWRLYAPIFEYCRIHKIPMVGLNAPIQLVKLVSKYGLEGLPPKLKQVVPENMEFGNEEHYRHFVGLLGAGHSDVDCNARNPLLERYYQVQVFWEEWMSQSVSLCLKEHPGTRMVALIGSGHVEGRFGFPQCFERRFAERPYTVVPRPVAWTSNEGQVMPVIAGPERSVGDLIWYTRLKTDVV